MAGGSSRFHYAILPTARLLDCSTARLLDCSTARLLDCIRLRRPSLIITTIGAGGIYSLARAAASLDVASGQFLVADIESDAFRVREKLLQLDRGYPAHCLFACLLKQQRAFCIRLLLSYLSQYCSAG